MATSRPLREADMDQSGTALDHYNYAHFAPGGSEDSELFKRVAPVGSPAPNFAAVRLRDRATVSLTDYLGGGYLVLEFGSVT